VAVLSGPAVMSSNESFLLMMKQVPGTVIVGSRSQGSSGNPKPFDLGNGVTAFLPSWMDLTTDGHELEGVGIAPDIEVNVSANDFKDSDPVLAAALEHLRKGGAKQ
jgi:C-terminal processing protease CtpA/Prc